MYQKILVGTDGSKTAPENGTKIVDAEVTHHLPRSLPIVKTT